MRRTMAVLLASGLLLAAGCGDDDDEEPSGGEPSTGEVSPPSTEPSDSGAEAPAEGTKVVLTEFKIDPANPTAKAGAVTFDVANEGNVPHALEIEGNGEEFVTDTLDGGQSAELQATLKPGEYKWYCPVGNHADQGMGGTLTVE